MTHGPTVEMKKGSNRLAYRTRLCRSRSHATKERRSSAGINEDDAKAGVSSEKKPSHSRWTMDVCGDVHSLELATTARDRLKGLLFTDPDDVTRLLIPCHDVHTYGMRYPLDIAFISQEGEVLDVHRNVATKRRLRNRRASLVAERFSREGDWLQKGDVVRIGTAE